MVCDFSKKRGYEMSSRMKVQIIQPVTYCGTLLLRPQPGKMFILFTTSLLHPLNGSKGFYYLLSLEFGFRELSVGL